MKEPTAKEPKAATPPEEERLDIVRASLLAEPDITLRERGLKTSIAKSTLSRLISKIKAEQAS